jgi:serine/threonine-protein kinase
LCQQVLGVRENVIVGIRNCNAMEQSSATNYDPVRGWPTDPKWASDNAARMAKRHAGEVKV